MMSPCEIEKYLYDAQRKAVVAMSQGKWSMFGYWAAQSVHLRKILCRTSNPSPFKPFSDLAEKMLSREGGLKL